MELSKIYLLSLEDLTCVTGKSELAGYDSKTMVQLKHRIQLTPAKSDRARLIHYLVANAQINLLTFNDMAARFQK